MENGDCLTGRFYIGQTAPDLPIITAAEYFFDHDPGVGNGTPVTILNSGFAISQQFSIPVPGTMPGALTSCQ